MARRRRQGRDEAKVVCDDPAEILRRRARRLADKGDPRGATLALRELVAVEGEARSWALLGAMLVRARRADDAIDAFKQAFWLHRKAGARARARTVARLLVALAPHDEKLARLAA
jgi:cytochrome c-type biogenesis protein CcmH/NrfG